MDTPGTRAGLREHHLQGVIVCAYTLAVLSSYAHFAKPFCAGQYHSLPADSALLTRFPCGGTTWQRALFICSNPAATVHDLLRLKGGDRWASIAMFLCLLRLPLVFLLPPRWYNPLATALSYAERGIPTVWHMLGYIGLMHLKQPTEHSVWYFRSVHAGSDLLQYITLPVLVPAVEALYSLVSFMCLAALSHSWAHTLPHLGLGMSHLLLRQALVLGLCMSLTALKWRGRRAADKAAAARRLGLQGTPQDRGMLKPAIETRAGGISVSAPPACSQPSAAAAAAVDRGFRSSALTTVQRHRNAAGQLERQQQAPYLYWAAPISQDPVVANDQTSSLAALAAPQAPAAPSAGTAAHSTAAANSAAAAVQPGVRTLPRYRSFINVRTYFAKIPGQDPSELTPGYEGRLALLLQALEGERHQEGEGGRHHAGTYRRLASVAVRAGCIELVMEEEEWGSGVEGDAYSARERCSSHGSWASWVGAAATDAVGPGGCAVLEQGESGVLLAGRLDGRCSSRLLQQTGGDSGNGLTLAAITQVLLLPQASDPGITDTDRNTPRVTSRATPEDVATLASRAAVQNGSWALPTVSVEPSVVLISDGSSQPSQRPTLRVTVSCLEPLPSGGGHSAAAQLVEVLVRTPAGYLPSAVRWEGSDAQEGSSSGIRDAPCSDGRQAPASDNRHQCVLALELLRLPTGPGVALVDVRWRGLPSVVVPIVLTADTAVAEELSAAVTAGAWLLQAELDSFLADYGTWECHAAAMQGVATGMLGAVPAEHVAALAAHLLSYAESNGLVATAQRIRTFSMKRQVRAPDAAATDATKAVLLPRSARRLGGVEAVAQPLGGTALPSGAAVPGPIAASGGSGGSSSTGGSSSLAVAPISTVGSRMLACSQPGPVGWLAALLLALGVRWLSCAQEAEYQRYAEAWAFTQAHVIHIVECISIFVAVVAVLHCIAARVFTFASPPVLGNTASALGPLSAVVRLLLPRPAWVRLEQQVRLPHYLACMLPWPGGVWGLPGTPLVSGRTSCH